MHHAELRSAERDQRRNKEQIRNLNSRLNIPQHHFQLMIALLLQNRYPHSCLERHFRVEKSNLPFHKAYGIRLTRKHLRRSCKQ